MKQRVAGVLVVLSMAAAGMAADIKVVTEYRYPTAFDVQPIMGIGPNGLPQMMGGIVTPTDFETREVGCQMSVIADIGNLAGLAAVTDGIKLLNNNTDLMLAATSGDFTAAKKMLARGTPVDAKNRFGSTAIMGAAAGGFDKIVKLLLDNRADPNVKSGDGSAPLLFAAKNGHIPVVQMLLDKGADINAADGAGVTPLMGAVRGGYTAVAKLLIQKGASVDRPDRNGSTPLMLAQAQNNRDMVVLLTRAGNGK